MSTNKKGKLYIPESHFNQVSVINCATSDVEKTIAIDDIPIMPLGSRPTVAIKSSDERKIYTCNFGVIPPTISAIDVETDECSSIIISSLAWGVFISPDDTELYLSLSNKTVEVISTKTNCLLRTLIMPDVPLAAIRDLSDNLYVSFASGEMGIFDVNTGAQKEPLIFTGGKLPAWFSFAKDYQKIYVATIGGIGVIDINTWELTKVIPLDFGELHQEKELWAFTTTLSPIGNSLYVTLMGESEVLIIDTNLERVIDSIKTNGTATGITFNIDGSRGYISDLGSSLSFLKGPIGGAVLANTWISTGMLGNGSVIVFDPENNNKIGDSILTSPGPGIPIWLST
ncbi:putative surface layer protein [Enterococcus sp. C1]|uniref:YncE family protein n=1 Tax=Enterococcus sp. C1 TaxID=1182762 RepID=UPI000272192C|nr:YncE family protein [Enterococcus sp. C1]EJF48107.1 putative surface layer protein [Enterococcus sp. C1]